MDLRRAAQAMRPLLDGCSDYPLPGGEATSIAHLRDMLATIEAGIVSGEKAHRWLGWAQGVVCCRGGATLDELKAINLAA